MASIFFYTRSPEMSIFDLDYFNNSKLNLEKIKEVMQLREASYNEKKIFNKEGYTQIDINATKEILSSTYIFENKLGQYTTISYDESDGSLKVSRAPYSYFGKSRLIITNDLNVIFKATYSSEENAKSKSIGFFEEIGLELEPLKLDDSIFQYIRKNYDWKKIKIQRIEREKDSTKSLSYEVDPASDKESEVDKIYNECGVFDHITFNIDFNSNVYTVRLYKQGHKISIDESQFDSKQVFEEFCLYLMNKFIEIKKEQVNINVINENLNNEGES